MDFATLSSAAFAPFAGKTLTVQAAQGELALEVYAIKENPLARGPNAKRTPFNVTLRGPDSPCLADGCYNMRADGEAGWLLEGVYLNRIIPSADSDGRGAFYQLIFG